MEGRREGLQSSEDLLKAEQGRKNAAIMLLRRGEEADSVALATGLDISEVLDLQEGQGRP